MGAPKFLSRFRELMETVVVVIGCGCEINPKNHAMIHVK
jgi:hypothetical protein